MERLAQRNAERMLAAVSELGGGADAGGQQVVHGAHLMPVSAAGYRLCGSVLRSAGRLA